MTYHFYKNNKETSLNPIRIEKGKQTGFSLGTDVKPGDTVTLLKYVIVASSLYYERQHLVETSTCMARKAKSDGWEALTKAHQQAWLLSWHVWDGERRPVQYRLQQSRLYPSQRRDRKFVSRLPFRE